MTEHAQRQYDVKPAPLETDRVSTFCKQWAAPIMLCPLEEYMTPYTDLHDYKKGKVFHVNYNWFKAMEHSNYDPRQSSSKSETMKMEWFRKRL